MTKLVVVEKTGLSSDVSFSEVSVKVSQAEALPPGLTVLLLEFDLTESMTGKPVKGFTFLLDEHLADRGIMLAGAYQKKEHLKVLLYNLGQGTVNLAPGSTVARAYAYDTVVLRQNTAAESITPLPRPQKKKRAAKH